MRVAIYTRISTDEDHQPFSLESQELRLRSYIASQEGWELVRIFTDQASGAMMEREDLQRALREARAGRFDLLLVYRVDRFSRRLRGLVELLDNLDKAGVCFRSATEPFDTSTPAGRMMVQMLGVFAEFERATIIDRVVAGMERRAARGAWNHGVSPYGYSVDKPTGFLTVRDDEAVLVPLIFSRYVHDRLGAREIANLLNHDGHRTRAGKPWSHAAVLTILKNPVYVGQIFYRGVYHEGPHPRLVTQELFDEAQRILTERGEDYSKRASNKSDYLLAGLIICDRCGKRFIGGTATGNRYTYRYYTCFSRHRYGVDTCDSERLPAEEIERPCSTHS
jgi:site-specific DNA recombinase